MNIVKKNYQIMNSINKINAKNVIIYYHLLSNCVRNSMHPLFAIKIKNTAILKSNKIESEN
jgi:hypothetical protein